MSFAARWADADPDAAGAENNPPEAGVYDVVLIEADAFTSKAGDDYVKLRWQRVDDPTWEWDQLQGFRTQAAASFAKREVRELGVDVDVIGSLDELRGAISTHIGSYYTVEVEQRGEYRDTYIRGSTRPDLAAAPPPAAAETEPDDIPF